MGSYRQGIRKLLLIASVSTVSLLFQEKDGRCQNGLVEFNASCYLFVDTHKNWFHSRDHCKYLGHFLAEVSSPEEIHFLKMETTARSKGTTCNTYWIGGTDMEQEGKWIWIENSEQVAHTDWGKNQPNNFENSDCLSLWKYVGFQWDDQSCDNSCCFICEGKLAAFETTTATTTEFTVEDIPESTTAETSKLETQPNDLSESNSTGNLSTFKTTSATKIQYTVEKIQDSATAEKSIIEAQPNDLSESNSTGIEDFENSTQEPGPPITTGISESQDMVHVSLKFATIKTLALNDSKMASTGNETCRYLCYEYESQDDIESSVLRLKMTLTVNKTQTSKYKRNLISAQDHRVSSKVMGYVGVVVLITVFSLIVAMDVAKIMNYVFSRRQLNRKLNVA